MKLIRPSGLTSTVIGMALLVLIGTGYYVHLRSLQKQAVFHDEAQQNALHLAADNKRLSELLALGQDEKKLSADQLRDLMRLRAEVTALRDRLNQSPPSTPAPTNALSESSPTNTVPIALARDSWSFSGYATPETAYESVFWAMSTGNVNTFLQALTPDGRRFINSQFQGKTPEEIAAALADEIKGIDVLRLDRKRQDENGVTFMLSAKQEEKAQQTGRDETVMTFQKIGSEWKLAMP